MTDLREKRQEADLSQRELADRVGISPSHLGNIERGQYDAPDDTIQAIREELDRALGEQIPPEDRLSPGQRRRIADRQGRARDR